jgi:predicted O-methyltransferase YrrM
MPETVIAGQLDEAERRLIMETITRTDKKPLVAIEVGTWLGGGGSTLHILRALEQNGAGHLWGIEADRSIYEQTLANIRAAAPAAVTRFTPLFGFSQDILKQWKKEQAADVCVDFAFLDGGNNPREQIEEFKLLDPLMPVGGQLMFHDAKMRKGLWLVPFVSRLDNWESKIHDIVTHEVRHPEPQQVGEKIIAALADLRWRTDNFSKPAYTLPK